MIRFESNDNRKHHQAMSHLSKALTTIEKLKTATPNTKTDALWQELEDELVTLAISKAPPPAEELQGTKAIVLFFATDQDREEFVQAIREAKPNMRTRKL